MLETNIRIVHPGASLWVWTKAARLSGSNLTAELAEKACNTLRYRHALAAAPSPSDPTQLIVATKYPILPIHLESEEWELDLTDAGAPANQVWLSSPDGEKVIPALIERAFLAYLSRRTDLQNSDSPRIWYEPNPFCVKEGIAAYYRYEIGTLLIENAGVGVSVDVGVAFFSAESLAYYFDPTLSNQEYTQRGLDFMFLLDRQAGQKGTLVYDNGRTRSKCYFESAPRGMTCATTGQLRIKGESYDSLFAYYQQIYPELPITEGTTAVRVSFERLDHPQPVAATRVKARVMNDDVPDVLGDVDKLSPQERRERIEAFWTGLDANPLGSVAPGFKRGFWRPPQDRIIRFSIPTFTFGNQQNLLPPKKVTSAEYRRHFHQRVQILKDAGCYHVPANITRTIYVAYPKTQDKDSADQFSINLPSLISETTGKPMDVQPIVYDSISDAIEQLRDLDKSGMVVFVLNKEPAAYFEVEFHLTGWHVKRVTEDSLREHHNYLKKGAYDKHLRKKTLEAGQKRWSIYVNFNALDVVQQLEVIPYRIDQAGPYEAQLVIDVGHDRRYFAVSLLVARNDKTPGFGCYTRTQDKGDHKTEGINPQILADEIVTLFSRHFPRRFDPLASLLILRDGRLVRQESSGLDLSIKLLQQKGYLTTDARVEQVDVHKETLKSIRMWEVNYKNEIENPLIGTGILLNKKTIALANTGVPGLTQGTANPILIVSNGRCPNVVDAAATNFAGAQLNWSSPGVPQHLHIGMKRTDDQLRARAAQEVRRLR